MQPEYIFETSWEVCNRVGGIYAVLSTRAFTMQKEYNGKVVFFGPDLGPTSDLYFHEEDCSPIVARQGWRIGRWMIPGEPIAILLKWDYLQEKKNDIYRWAWDNYGVQSHAAYGDYDDSCLFGYAVGEAMRDVYQQLGCPITAAHSNEWQTAFTLFYLKHYCPSIATLFTTHATGIGRSIAGNGKPLYDYFEGYHGDQMAEELNMVSKHSAEKHAAWEADCFTTVSELTARECKQLLDKSVDIVTPNGFEQTFVPQKKDFPLQKEQAREALRAIAQKALGRTIQPNVCMTCIAGRQEWKNKGIDVFIDSMRYIGEHLHPGQEIVAFVMIPYLNKPVMQWGKVSVVFLPYYLPTDEEPLLQGKTYYQLLIGMDISIFPSYYEPWGYTPLESIAFGVPTITTSLAGFGVWANGQETKTNYPAVSVIERNDSNYEEVVERIARKVTDYIGLDKKEQERVHKAAGMLAKKADWKHFFTYYKSAYEIALAHNRQAGKHKKK